MRTTATPTGKRVAVLGPMVLCFGSAGVGCAGTLDDPSRFRGDGGRIVSIDGGGGCPDIPNSMFATICATAGCHSTADMVQGLDLQSPDVASRLVGVCARGGGFLVDPGHPSQSVVYAKLTIAPPFGSRMPLGKPALDAATLACVLAWVSAQTGSATACGDDGGAALDGD